LLTACSTIPGRGGGNREPPERQLPFSRPSGPAFRGLPRLELGVGVGLCALFGLVEQEQFVGCDLPDLAANALPVVVLAAAQRTADEDVTTLLEVLARELGESWRWRSVGCVKSATPAYRYPVR